MYKSIAENFYETGAEEALFRVPTGTAVAPYNFADLQNLEALSKHLKERGSIGATTGERAFGDGLLTQLARHPANPLQLVDNANYTVTEADHFVVEYGTTNGVASIWDAVIAPHLKNFGISTDPGVVPPTPGRPDGGALEKPTPVGTAQDPAMALNFQLQKVIIDLGNYWTNGNLERISETDYWRETVAPLLKNPLLSGG